MNREASNINCARIWVKLKKVEILISSGMIFVKINFALSIKFSKARSSLCCPSYLLVASKKITITLSHPWALCESIPGG